MPSQTAPVSEYQTSRTPLVGMINTREFDSSGNAITGPTSGTIGIGVIGSMIIGNQNLLIKDQRFINCIPTKLTNELTSNSTFYLIKRPGWQSHTTPSAGNPGKYLGYWGSRVAGAAIMSSFKSTNSEIFRDTTSLGLITGETIYMAEFTIGTTQAFLVQSNDNSLWYTTESILNTIVGTTHTSITIDGIATTVGLFIGQGITGSGIPANTRIATIIDGVSITITNPTTNSLVGITIATTSLAKVINVNYPGNQTPVKTVRPGAVFLNGFLYVMDSNGVVYNSDLNSIASWTANGSINSNSYPDGGQVIVRYRNLVVAFNTTSTEYFSDVGNPSGTPLQNNTNSTTKIGAASPYAVASIEDSLVWVSATDRGGSSVYLLQNYYPQKISTPIIDQQIALVGASTVRVSAAKFFGRTFVFVILTNNTYMYCIEDKMWHEWNSDINYWDFIAVASVGANHLYGISLSGTSGKVWRLDVQTVIYTDNGNNYTMTIQTSKIDNNNDFRKRISKLTVIGDRTVITSNIDISFSDDDYQTFSTPRTVDMSGIRAYLNNYGPSFRRRAFKLVNTSNTSLRLEALEFNTVQGIN